MKLFDAASKVFRKNSTEIFKGFGFHHLSDVTGLYVQPGLSEFNVKTTLFQSTGEALLLLASMLGAEKQGKAAC